VVHAASLAERPPIPDENRTENALQNLTIVCDRADEAEVSSGM